MQIYHGTEQTLDARTFLSILREDYEGVFLTSCVIEGAAIFSTESTIDVEEQSALGARLKTSLNLRKLTSKRRSFSAILFFKKLFISGVPYFTVPVTSGTQCLKGQFSLERQLFAER